MAREIDLTKPLSDEDVEYLRARLPESQVERMVYLASGEDGKEDAEAPVPEDRRDLSPKDLSGSEEDGEDSEEEEDLDLIGDGDDDEGDELSDFDPKDHTVAEVEDHLKDSPDAEKERVLALEREGRNRSTLVG